MLRNNISKNKEKKAFSKGSSSELSLRWGLTANSVSLLVSEQACDGPVEVLVRQVQNQPGKTKKCYLSAFYSLRDLIVHETQVEWNHEYLHVVMHKYPWMILYVDSEKMSLWTPLTVSYTVTNKHALINVT